MRTITIDLYRFHELSDQAKAVAYLNWDKEQEESSGVYRLDAERVSFEDFSQYCEDLEFEFEVCGSRY